MLATLCQYVFDCGENIGKQCQIKPRIGLYCSKHKKYSSIQLTEETQKCIQHAKKLEYYKSHKLHDRLYGRTNIVPNLNYSKPCLNFTGYTNTGGYCCIKLYKRFVCAHVLSYALSHNMFVEEIPTRDENGELLDVCHGHGCSKSCIEPTHLSLKSKSINLYDDKLRDHTLPVGEKHYSCKITEEQATKIKSSKGEGTISDRATRFGVSKDIVASIDGGYNWSYLLDHNGHLGDSYNRRRRISEYRKKKKGQEWTSEDWVEALRKLREKSIDSKQVSPNVSTPCHLFQGQIDKDGYGIVSFKGYSHRAHILACESKQGKKRKMHQKIVRHLCDVRNCCNPEHLEFGTAHQNAIDAINHNKLHKLNTEKAKEIKLLLKENQLSQKEIADKYHVARNTISSIKSGSMWAHVII